MILTLSSFILAVIFDCIFHITQGIGQKMAEYIIDLRETSPMKSVRNSLLRSMILKILDLGLLKKLSLLSWFVQLDDLEKIGLTSKQVMLRNVLSAFPFYSSFCVSVVYAVFL